MAGRRQTSDVLIVGAGILGAATAYHLAAAGHTVVVLERGPVNREGSGTTAGNVHIQAIHARRPGQIAPVDIGRMLPLQVMASRYWSTIEDDLERRVELRRGGGFMIAETAAEMAELRRKHALESSPACAPNSWTATRRAPRSRSCRPGSRWPTGATRMAMPIPCW